MITFFIISGLLLFFTMVALLWRVVTGPSVMDRIVAINLIGTKTTVLLVIIGIVFGRVDMFIDFALTYALLNFIASLAASNYFQRHATVEATSTLAVTAPTENS